MLDQPNFVTPEQEINWLRQEQEADDAEGFQATSFADALLFPPEHVGVHFADDRPEAARILDAEGFDHTTGCDTAFDSSHAGAMLCAGFALMEHDDVDS